MVVHDLCKIEYVVVCVVEDECEVVYVVEDEIVVVCVVEDRIPANLFKALTTLGRNRGILLIIGIDPGIT